jgi:hypothetical protein
VSSCSGITATGRSKPAHALNNPNISKLRPKKTGLTSFLRPYSSNKLNLWPAAGSGELPFGSPIYESDWVINQGYTAKHPEIDITRPLDVAQGTQVHTP